MNKVLFITWDGPQTSYMEGLFMPIFGQLKKQYDVEFHVVQFTWANNNQLRSTRIKAAELNIVYHAFQISRKPSALIGTIITLFRSVKFIRDYIGRHAINIIMPRSTMPAIMVNRIKKDGIKVIFDADGFPLEERVDFAGLSKRGFQYRILKNEETKILRNSDAVITRSQKASKIHTKTIGEEFANKFFVVSNGRDEHNFKFKQQLRELVRASYDLKSETLVFIYSGSLGAQYGWEEMCAIVLRSVERRQNVRWFILTGQPEYVDTHLPLELKAHTLCVTVSPDQVGRYLCMADIAFAIRKPSYSMQAVSPVKLYEYLINGIPTVVSLGIGDTDELIKNNNHLYPLDHQQEIDLSAIHNWINKYAGFNRRNEESLRAAGRFSLEASAQSYIKAINYITNEGPLFAQIH